MNLKFIKPPKDKLKLYKIALRIASEELTINSEYKNVKTARASIMQKANKEYQA